MCSLSVYLYFMQNVVQQLPIYKGLLKDASKSKGGCTALGTCKRSVVSGLDVSLEWAKIHDVGILKPDCVLYFDLLPDEARKRSGFGDERLEAYEYQCTVYKFMQSLGSENADIWKAWCFTSLQPNSNR